MFADRPLITSLPASDIERAKAWYRDKLDLKPYEEDEGGGARYQCGPTWFMVYPSQFAGTNKATAAAWEVDDLEATVKELQARGVEFQEYDLPEIKTQEGILTTPDGAKIAWFTDSEGNIIGLSEGM